jgi:hypothetical protein
MRLPSGANSSWTFVQQVEDRLRQVVLVVHTPDEVGRDEVIDVFRSHLLVGADALLRTHDRTLRSRLKMMSGW